MFDNDGDGLVSYVELVDFIDDGDADEDDDRVEEVLYDLKKLVRDAEKRGVDYRASFEHFDTDYTGEIDAKGFRKGLRKLGFDVNDADVDRLIAKFSGRRGRDKLQKISGRDCPRTRDGS